MSLLISLNTIINNGDIQQLKQFIEQHNSDELTNLLKLKMSERFYHNEVFRFLLDFIGFDLDTAYQFEYLDPYTYLYTLDKIASYQERNSETNINEIFDIYMLGHYKLMDSIINRVVTFDISITTQALQWCNSIKRLDDYVEYLIHPNLTELIREYA